MWQHSDKNMTNMVICLPMEQQWDKNMIFVAMCLPMWRGTHGTKCRTVIITCVKNAAKIGQMFTNVTQGTSWTKRQRNLMKKFENKMMVMVMMMAMMINKIMEIVTSRRWWSRRWWSCWSLLASLQSQPSKPNFSYMYYIHTGWASKNLLRLKSTCLYSFWKI